MISLVIFGLVTGIVSGFFGIGGGTILVPLLLLYGYNIKFAIAISVTQMVVGSIFGTVLNINRYKSILKDGIFLGFGGLVGGILSGFLVFAVEEVYLKYLFLSIVLFSLYKMLFLDIKSKSEKKEFNRAYIFLLGIFVGTISISVGVGGALLLTPILVAYFYYDLKEATSLSLFFVIFSSSAGFFTMLVHNLVPYYQSVLVSLGVICGVYIGIRLKDIIHIRNYKIYLIILYIIIFSITFYKL